MYTQADMPHFRERMACRILEGKGSLVREWHRGSKIIEAAQAAQAQAQASSSEDEEIIDLVSSSEDEDEGGHPEDEGGHPLWGYAGVGLKF